MEAIARLSPDAEPTPADLAGLQDLIQRRRHHDGVLRDAWSAPPLADALAERPGVQTEVLDPIEGLADDTADEDYLSLMRSNLTKLRAGERMLTDQVVKLDGRGGRHRRPPGPARHRPDRRGGRVRGADGRQRVRQVHAGPGADRAAAADAGTLELFGTRWTDFDDWHRIGFVPQRPGAAPAYPPRCGRWSPPARLTRRRLLRPLSRADRAAIDEASPWSASSDRPATACRHLSGGQQQRVLIARALAGEPDLFFLDEPTAGVDLPNQQALADALAELKRRGATIVLVAHELGPLATLVDRAVVMRDGRVAYDGAPLGDHEVHSPDFGEAHTHHHHRTAGPPRPRARRCSCPSTPAAQDEPS